MKLLFSTVIAAGGVLLVNLLGGCVSADVVNFDSTARPAKTESQVEVLMKEPARPHRVIARIQIGPDAFVSNYQGQTNELIKRAAALGADAVIVSYSSSVSGFMGGAPATGGYGAVGESKFTVGQVIVYEPEADLGH
jgi:hypothetical protein